MLVAESLQLDIILMVFYKGTTRPKDQRIKTYDKESQIAKDVKCNEIGQIVDLAKDDTCRL